MESAVGKRIQEAIQLAGWDQLRLASELGFSKAKVTRFVKDTNKRWSIPELERIASLLGVNPRWLAGWENNPFPAPPSGSVPRWVPLLGTIAAGTPLFAAQHIESYLPLPPDNGADFALRVRGDSMTGDCIPDGAVVLCRKQEDVDDGEIGVCIVDGEEATLKHVHRHESIVILKASNPTHKDIVLSARERKTITIVGKPLAVFYEL